jgi:hypothetical protein
MFLIKKYIHNKCQETQSYKEMYLSKKKKKVIKKCHVHAQNAPTSRVS